ncbi:hypothetical protein HRR95_003399 [Exophiala dermatitidis]|nr:hypothetical protein HRR79_002199 [Exophiala dermatitidis]KAJ4587660.1 hypothetical protein HRR82_001461 [Exophiala dermatitidis]KAJ4681351.1 hypothetical protein HRR95_003399 [Exophiala dermatitidis]
MVREPLYHIERYEFELIPFSIFRAIAPFHRRILRLYDQLAVDATAQLIQGQMPCQIERLLFAWWMYVIKIGQHGLRQPVQRRLVACPAKDMKNPSEQAQAHQCEFLT